MASRDDDVIGFSGSDAQRLLTLIDSGERQLRVWQHRFDGSGSFGAIETEIQSIRIASAAVEDEAPYTGLTIAAALVLGTASGRQSLIGTEVDVVDHAGCILNLTEDELLDVHLWAWEMIFESLDPAADPGDLTPLHWSTVNRCCPV